MKHLTFKDVDGDKHEYNVHNKKKEYLGWIEYDEVWKCWVFMPSIFEEVSTPQFSAGCLKEIIDFMEKLK